MKKRVIRSKRFLFPVVFIKPTDEQIMYFADSMDKVGVGLSDMLKALGAPIKEQEKKDER